MLDTRFPLEKWLQHLRFNKVKRYLKGHVLDFGGNKGELRSYCPSDYTLVNYDHSPLYGQQFDTIVSLAVIEHLTLEEINTVFARFKSCLKKNGSIYLTTPPARAQFILEGLAHMKLLDAENLLEHKHYLHREDIEKLATQNGLEVRYYGTFLLGFNQFIQLTHQAVKTYQEETEFLFV